MASRSHPLAPSLWMQFAGKDVNPSAQTKVPKLQVDLAFPYHTSTTEKPVILLSSVLPQSVGKASATEKKDKTWQLAPQPWVSGASNSMNYVLFNTMLSGHKSLQVSLL